MGVDLIKIDSTSSVPKYLQIVDSVLAAVSDGELSRGDKLPSLGAVAKHFGLSINTVVKAYDVLKRRGLARATFGQGFYLSSDQIDVDVNVFALFDEINMFKEDLYTSFKSELGEGARVDVFFHHFNSKVFKSLIGDAKGCYTHYVVMPLLGDEALSALRELDAGATLLLDRRYRVDGVDFRFVGQDHTGGTRVALETGVELIREYSTLRLVEPGRTELEPFSAMIRDGASSFCRASGVPFTVEKDFDFSGIRADDVYLVVSERDLVSFVLACRRGGLEIGRDVGLIAYNDMDLREIIDTGVSSISTDFKRMGRLAAERVLDSGLPGEVIPTELKVRRSLRRC